MQPTLRPAVDTDARFAFAAKKEAMGPHISARWGWDEEYQLSVHGQRWNEKPWFIVAIGEQSIGTLSLKEEPEFTRFGEFYLLGNFRRKGIGTNILTQFPERCDQSKRSVRLEYQKWNPVGSLYERHGFEIESENDIHYFMVRTPR